MDTLPTNRIHAETDKTTDQQRDAAARYVLRHSLNDEDGETLLGMLGLLNPFPPESSWGERVGNFASQGTP